MSVMKLLPLVLIVALGLAGFACGGNRTSAKVDTTPVAEFDLNRYLGTWYEIARYDHRFERGVEQPGPTTRWRRRTVSGW